MFIIPTLVVSYSYCMVIKLLKIITQYTKSVKQFYYSTMATKGNKLKICSYNNNNKKID